MQAQITIDRFLRSNLSYPFMLNAFERILLVMLASYTANGNKDNCFPSHHSLARDCGMSTDSVKRNLKSLEAKSLIKILRFIGSNNHYELLVPSADSTESEQHLGANSTNYHAPSAHTPNADSPPNNISNNKKKYTSSKPKTSKQHFPTNFTINDSHKEKASSLGLDIDSEFENFKEHHIAKGNTFANWEMAFNTWLRNAAKFQNKKAFHKTDITAGVCYE